MSEFMNKIESKLENSKFFRELPGCLLMALFATAMLLGAAMIDKSSQDIAKVTLCTIVAFSGILGIVLTMIYEEVRRICDKISS